MGACTITAQPSTLIYQIPTTMARFSKDPMVIKAKFNSLCMETNKPIRKGQDMLYYPLSRNVYCLDSNAYRQFLADAHDMRMEDMLSGF